MVQLNTILQNIYIINPIRVPSSRLVAVTECRVWYKECRVWYKDIAQHHAAANELLHGIR